MKTINVYNPLLKEVMEVTGEVLSQDERLFLIDTEENRDFSPYGVRYIIFDIKTGSILCCSQYLSDMSKTYGRYKKIYEKFIKTNLYERMCKRGEKNV